MWAVGCARARAGSRRLCHRHRTRHRRPRRRPRRRRPRLHLPCHRSQQRHRLRLHRRHHFCRRRPRRRRRCRLTPLPAQVQVTSSFSLCLRYPLAPWSGSGPCCGSGADVDRRSRSKRTPELCCRQERTDAYRRTDDRISTALVARRAVLPPCLIGPLILCRKAKARPSRGRPCMRALARPHNHTVDADVDPILLRTTRGTSTRGWR